LRDVEGSITTSWRYPVLLLLALAVSATAAFAGGGATPLGPTPYLSAADSPFPLGTGTFCLEDFEGAGFDVPGVTGNGSLTLAGSITDSVDGDDGTIDGSGTGGQSYFSGDGSGGITFTFDPKEDGEAKCASGDAKKARKRLQQTAQKLTQFAHRLRSNASRKKIPAEVREPLAAEADRIRADAKTLRGALDCGGG